MTFLNTHIDNIGQVIQLAVAPVFLLAGVGQTLNVLVGRLVRIVDRARLAEEQLAAAVDTHARELHERLSVLAKRAKLISRAIALTVLCAVLVPIVIVTLFVSALLQINLEWPIAIVFIIALVSLAAGLVYFLREVFVATAVLTFSISESNGERGDGTQHLRHVVKNS
ncbi:MAG TPA: DUF2721 domain-containing protein [Steroidobacteraceae bacterium]|nr:DUF2721 domain-containing protein [Steroidobacteraceae bacterium]